MTTMADLPLVPAKHANFISYVASKPTTPVPELLEPYIKYDAKLREVFAQEPTNPLIQDHHLNLVPVFSGTNGKQELVKIRARNLENEDKEEKERYIMPLGDEERRPTGAPALVESLEEFRKNFAVFCESALADLDWRNVVAGGSSVVTCLLPVEEQYKGSKRALRKLYHEKLAPASDIDLFIYGLSEEEAIKKILQIEQCVKDTILQETTTVRTKNAITIVSQYPNRHIQIVLRRYKSPAEILTGFDVDCSCAAYDGTQVWASPRALAAYMTQTNTIDLSRRSPSYENRLSKYSHRGFEVYWPLLDRSRVDPTVFERNFGRTLGLARLLVLERLPTKSGRDAYIDERRKEMGRPPIFRGFHRGKKDDIKEQHEDEVAEWVQEDDVSNYHSFHIPYGPKYNAKKIEKLLYTKDLLMNAEWNKKDDREVNLHRHPAFFGDASDVIRDCCGFCPKPMTEEEIEFAEEEAKIYVSGNITFIEDDPGRQAIGSFHPLTDDDWTEMAYVGNTQVLCQAIIDHDLETCKNWLSQEGSDPNCRDYTGRTPLHLAVMSSTPEIVQLLIDHGARLVARLVDGRTALHLAAARGDIDIIRMIMIRSERNEEEAANKENARKQARTASKTEKSEAGDFTNSNGESEDDIEMIDADDSDEDMKSTTTGSYIKVKDDEKNAPEDLLLEDDQSDEPDVYDVNVLTWDTKCSPLHYAILHGHTEVVKELVQNFGADVLIPIKLVHDYDKTPKGAILTLVLALELPLDKAKKMTKVLLEIGASSAQADMHQATALHYASVQQPEVLDVLFAHDKPAAKRAVNHMAVTGAPWSPFARGPLLSAISTGNVMGALKLLENGAASMIDAKDWIKSCQNQFETFSKSDPQRNRDLFSKSVEQPIVAAAKCELPEVVMALLEQGADVNSLTQQTHIAIEEEWKRGHLPMQSLLDVVREKVQKLRDYKPQDTPEEPGYQVQGPADYFANIEPGTYKDFTTRARLEYAKKADAQARTGYGQLLKLYQERKGVEEKKRAVVELTAKFERVEQELLARGAKTFADLHPDIKQGEIEKRPDWKYTPSKPSPFSCEFTFNGSDMTEESQEAYLRLFQASWDGDLETIKALTLTPRGDKKDIAPLEIAVYDNNTQSPFSIAVLRGHKNVARAILQIALAQYSPDNEQKTKIRYRMAEDTERYSDADSDVGTNDVRVLKEIIDHKFTVDNIGEVATQVKSKTSPKTLLEWNCSAWAYTSFALPDTKYTYGMENREVVDSWNLRLISWAIATNNMDLFNFLADLHVEWTDRMADKSEDFIEIPTLTDDEFRLAIEYGRTEMLSEMIRRFGAGIELSALVKDSGTKLAEKPKYYQGLNVRGRKRKDWVAAARGSYEPGETKQSPPLLRAARNGCLASVEYFLSSTPLRLYKEFAETYKQHKIIRHLDMAAGGFENVLSKWLVARQEFALHCAVLAKPGQETTALIQYLLKIMPKSLELKSRTGGHTPLALAFSLRRFEAAKLLIAASADQTVRDFDGANILHLMLCSRYRGKARDERVLPKFLDLIDKRLIPSLLTERSSHEPGSLTPVSRWIRHSSDPEALTTILDFADPTNNAHLELLNGSGDTPVHCAVRAKNHPQFLRIMLGRRPDLLYCENAVGRTPWEVAEAAWVAECAAREPSIEPFYRPGMRSIIAMVDRPAQEFSKDFEIKEPSKTERMWRICKEFMSKQDGAGSKKRKLVSLTDANEVANRLAKRHQGVGHGRQDTESGARRGRVRVRRVRRSRSMVDEEEEEDEGNGVMDEVAEWYNGALVYTEDESVGGGAPTHALDHYQQQLWAFERSRWV